MSNKSFEVNTWEIQKIRKEVKQSKLRQNVIIKNIYLICTYKYAQKLTVN